MGSPALFVLGLLSLFLLTGGGNGQGGGILDRGSDDPRLLVNALRLIKLQEKLEAVKEKLETVKKAEMEDKIYSDVGTRVSKLEGTGCRDNQIQCGDTQECVSELLVCDGTEDCHNGHDEDLKYCNVSEIRAGMTFHTWYNFEDCNFGGRKHYFCRWTFLSVKQSKVFKSILDITNQWKCDWGDDPAFFNTDTYTMVSHYHIAGRRYVEHNYGYRSECYFPEDNFDEVHCKNFYGETLCVPHMIFFRDK